jgi:hypothetical protein
MNQYKNYCIHLRDWSCIIALFSILILNIWRWDVDTIYCFSAQTKLRPTKPTCIYVHSPNLHCSHRHPAAIIFLLISLCSCSSSRPSHGSWMAQTLATISHHVPEKLVAPTSFLYAHAATRLLLHINRAWCCLSRAWGAGGWICRFRCCSILTVEISLWF